MNNICKCQCIDYTVYLDGKAVQHVSLPGASFCDYCDSSAGISSSINANTTCQQLHSSNNLPAVNSSTFQDLIHLLRLIFMTFYFLLRENPSPWILSVLSFQLQVKNSNCQIVTTLFLLLLLLWTFELYLILSYRYEDILISWSYLLILSWRSYLLIYDLILISWSYHLMMIQDMFLYINFTLLLTCIRHAFDSCLSLTINMHSTHVAAQHAFTLLLTCFGHTLYMCLPWGQHMDISI